MGVLDDLASRITVSSSNTQVVNDDQMRLSISGLDGMTYRPLVLNSSLGLRMQGEIAGEGERRLPRPSID